MKTRPNDQAKLFNVFNTSSYTQIDSLPVKWPHNSERIDDASWLRADEKRLVPFVGRTIRSSHFNQMADAVVSLQHYLKSNIGTVYTVLDGVAELCSSVSTGGGSYTGVSPVSVFTEGNTLLAFQTISHNSVSVGSSTASAVVVSGYANIPAQFGATPFTSRSFNTTISVEVSGSSDKGWRESRTATQALARMKQDFLCMAGTCPGSSNTTVKYQVILPKLTTFSAAASSSSIVNYPWAITKNLSEDSFDSDSSSVLQTATRGSKKSVFYFWYNSTAGSTGSAGPTTGSISNNLTAMPSSLNLLECKGAGNWTIPYGATDSTSHGGGIIFHDSIENFFALNAGIEFTWHSWQLPTYWIQNYPFFHLAGPALRVVKHTTSKSVSGYTTGSQYSGYAVRFFAYPNNRSMPITDFNNASGAYQKDIVFAGSVAIVKFRYDDFGFENTLMSSVYQNSTYNAHLTGAGGWWGVNVAGTNAEGYYYSNNNPAEYKILASTTTEYVSGTGSYDPVLQLDADNSHWYFAGPNLWRFEMIDDVLYLKRSIDGSNWTTILTYTDTDPIEPDGSILSGPPAHATYLPSAFYCKPYTGMQLSESEMVFSNIISYLINDTETAENPDSNINLKVKLLMSMVNSTSTDFPLTSI